MGLGTSDFRNLQGGIKGLLAVESALLAKKVLLLCISNALPRVDLWESRLHTTQLAAAHGVNVIGKCQVLQLLHRSPLPSPPTNLLSAVVPGFQSSSFGLAERLVRGRKSEKRSRDYAVRTCTGGSCQSNSCAVIRGHACTDFSSHLSFPAHLFTSYTLSLFPSCPAPLSPRDHPLVRFNRLSSATTSTIADSHSFQTASLRRFTPSTSLQFGHLSRYKTEAWIHLSRCALPRSPSPPPSSAAPTPSGAWNALAGSALRGLTRSWTRARYRSTFTPFTDLAVSFDMPHVHYFRCGRCLWWRRRSGASVCGRSLKAWWQAAANHSHVNV